MRRQGSSSTVSSYWYCIVERVSRREEALERQPVQADDLVARGAVDPAVQAEDERRDHEVQGPAAGQRLHLVESPKPLAVPPQVETGLLEGLPDGGRLGTGVARLGAAAGKAHVSRPRVLLVLGAADEEELDPARAAVAKDERHRRARRVARDAEGRVAGDGARQIVPAGHEPPPARARSARAWVSQRKAMFGASSPRTSRPSTSAGAA